MSAQTSTAVAYQYSVLKYPGSFQNTTDALGINNNNVIVGSYYIDAFSTTHGFKYSNGKYSTIDFPGAVYTAVLGINDNGDVVGEYLLSSPGNFHGFLRHAGVFTTIDDLGAPSTMLAGINNAGTIVGNRDSNYGFVYKNGTFTDYNPPSRAGLPTYFSTLSGINNPGCSSASPRVAIILRGFGSMATILIFSSHQAISVITWLTVSMDALTSSAV